MRRIWFGDDDAARAARLALAPAERLFAGISGLRTILYDAGWLKSAAAGVPVVSVGNLTVGGTGKTPVAAWIARRLRDRGARPAVILRGYGRDEPLVHATINPDIEVVTGANRLAAVREAIGKGCDIAVLDDGFQHRQLQRDVDIVLISADRWQEEARLLPAGPWREPLTALRRAHLVIVTRKSAGPEDVERVHESLSRVAPRVPRVSVYLEAAGLVQVDGDGRAALAALRGESILAVSSIGDPVAFARQLEAFGARVTPMAFGDHHDFSAADVRSVISRSGATDRVVCTLKDAVKLRDIWPRVAPTLWYVSQRVIVERGEGGIDRLLDGALDARTDLKSPAQSDPV